MTHRDRRLAVLKHYGERCVCCGTTEYRFLAIDHMAGNGNVHRKQIGRNLSTWLYYNGMPEGFRVLCHNCNGAIRSFNQDVSALQHAITKWHEGELIDVNSRLTGKLRIEHQYHFNLRLAAIQAYGISCHCCGEDFPYFLTLDHIEGGGVQFRKRSKKGSGLHLYLDLRRSGYPPGLRTLCYNCNMAVVPFKGNLTELQTLLDVKQSIPHVFWDNFVPPATGLTQRRESFDGTCYSCQEPAAPGKTECTQHLAQGLQRTQRRRTDKATENAKLMARRAQKRALGICRTCSSFAVPGKTECQRHLDLSAARVSRRRYSVQHH